MQLALNSKVFERLIPVSSTPFSSTSLSFHGILVLHDAAGEGAGGIVEGAARGSGGELEKVAKRIRELTDESRI